MENSTPTSTDETPCEQHNRYPCWSCMQDRLEKPPGPGVAVHPKDECNHPDWPDCPHYHLYEKVLDPDERTGN